MAIFVDADACPVVIRDILCRAAERTGTATTFVANHRIPLPGSRHLKSIQVPKGFDVADHEIVRRVEAGDLVVTGDIPLASEVIDKGATALNPRGELYTSENIRARLSMRDFMDSMRETMRAAGTEGGGAPPLSASDRLAFGNALDRWLAGHR